MARKQYPLRIDPAIWEAVERWAADEMRSSNGQVEWIIRDALRRAGRLPESAAPARSNRRAGSTSPGAGDASAAGEGSSSGDSSSDGREDPGSAPVAEGAGGETGS